MNRKKKFLTQVTSAILAVCLLITVWVTPALAADDCTTINVSGVVTTVEKEEILQRVNQIRLEAYNEGIIDEYVPAKWSMDMEEIALQRAAEVSISFSHTRPNGSSCSSVKASSGETASMEVIASSSSTMNAINMWYSEKKNIGGSGETGHYFFLCVAEYIGIASFGVTVGEGSWQPSEEKQLVKNGTQITKPVEIQKSMTDEYGVYFIRDNYYFGTADAIQLAIGNSSQLKAMITGWGNLNLVGTYTSSNNSVAQVSATGKVTAVGPGTCTITFTSGPWSVTQKFEVKPPRWVCDSNGWWYDNGDGTYPSSCWKQIDGVYYYFKDNGYMAANEYIDGYWLNADGSWTYPYTAGWKVNATGWWYEDTAGWYPSGCWLMIDNEWYYFYTNGYMATNTIIDGWLISSDGAARPLSYWYWW